MTELTSFASIPVIMAFCYFIALAFKWAIADPDGKVRNKKALAFLPVLCGAVGLAMGIITYYSNPEVIHSDNVLAAAATGLSSGLASVGIESITKRKTED